MKQLYKLVPIKSKERTYTITIIGDINDADCITKITKVKDKEFLPIAFVLKDILDNFSKPHMFPQWDCERYYESVVISDEELLELGCTRDELVGLAEDINMPRDD